MITITQLKRIVSSPSTKAFGCKLIALDVGTRKTGVAISDSSFMTSHPLCKIIMDPTDEYNRACRDIKDLIVQHRAAAMIVGWPNASFHDFDGDGELKDKMCPFIKKFIRHFQVQSNLKIPILLYDESFTSKDARDLLANRNNRVSKKNALKLDQIAASFILQNCLNDLRDT